MSKQIMPWTKQQRKIYQRLATWLTFYFSRGYQVLRLDLTSAETESPDYRGMIINFKKLIARVEKTFGYDVQYFYVQTKEGFGVLHTCIAMKHDNAVYVPFEWIKENWLELHGAFGVYIKRVSSEVHRVNAARYMVSQYLSGQVMIRRCDYSRNDFPFSIAKVWKSFKDTISARMPDKWAERVFGREIMRKEKMPSWQVYKLWENLIKAGTVQIGDEVFAVANSRLVPIYEIQETHVSTHTETEVPF